MDGENITVTKLEKVDGVFENDKGQKIEYTNYFIYFKIGDNPLTIKAKVEKVYKEAIKEILEQENL